MMVLLMASSHTSASVEVLRWLLCLAGGRGRHGVKAKAKGEGVLGGAWHTDGPYCLSKRNMQTLAFREINTLPQAAKSASGG